MKALSRAATTIFILAATVVLAQKPAAIELGFKSERVYEFSGIDNVNVFNGNNVVTIPIGMRYPLTSTFSYGLTLVYNSKVWDHRRVQTYMDPGVDYWWAKPNLRSNVGVGWRMSLGRLLPPSGPTTIYPDDHRNQWVYEGPSGDEHSFSSIPYSAAVTEDPAAAVQFSLDGPRLRMIRLTSSTDTSRRIEFPDGQMHTFDFENNAWRLKHMEDRFGNHVDIDYVYDADRVTQWTISDSIGRTHKVYFTYVPALADSIDKGMSVYLVQLEGVAGENGARREYEYNFHVVSQTVPYSCYHDYVAPMPGAPSGLTTTLPVLTGIDLPDGSAFSFTYQSTNEGCGSGLLKQLTLPTRGVIDYTYQLYTLNDGACVPTGPRNSTPGVATRTVDSNTTKYMLTRGPSVTPVPPGSQPSNCGVALDGTIPPNESRRWHRTSILSPQDAAGNRTRSDHYFNMWTAAGADEDPEFEAHEGTYFRFGEAVTAGWPGPVRAKLAPPEVESSADVTATDVGTLPQATNRSLANQLWTTCAADGSCTTLLRSNYRRMTSMDPQAQRVSTSERTLFHDDSGCTGTCYVQSDNVLTSWDRIGHFETSTTSSNFPGVTGDSSTTEYVSWSDAALRNSVIPWVLERYTARSRAVGTQSTRSTFCFDQHGQLLRQRALSEAIEQPTDLLTRYSWLGGNVVADWSFGGDSGGLGMQPEVCTATLPAAGYDNRHTWANGVLATSKYAAMDFFSLDYTSDKTGLITASRATDATLETTYKYDSWGRLREVRPPSETPTSYILTNATASAGPRIVAKRDSNPASTSDDVVLTYDYDRMGRVRRTERTLPGAGCTEQEVAYDALGRKSTESVWKTCGSSGAVTQFLYDPLGRIRRVTAPDGTQSNVQYTGNRIIRRTVDSGGFSSSTDEHYDVLGRLVEVTQDVTGAQPLTTKYIYDAGDRLITVTILGADGDQPRVFNYDGRGLLTSETQPELGVLGYGTASYKYDSRGHVTQTIAGAFDLTYVYDAAERLTEIREASGRLLEQYVYDSYPPLAPTPGRLSAAARFNYDSDLGSASGVAVIHTFHYHADSGRLGLRYTTVGALPGIAGVSFSSAQTYDALGQLETIGYPCRTESCTGDERARTVINEYTNGSLSSVWNWASAITYHPSGAINTVTHGSGSAAIRESWTPDPNGMGRPASIQATNNANTQLWSTGTYTYDGSGNITNIGTTRYNYDAFQRLTGWLTANGTSTSIAYVGYDSYGNQLYSQRESCGTGPNGPICVAPGFMPRVMRGTTNHYLEATYDAAGNLTSDEFRTFTYDRLSKITRTQIQDRDFRYIYAPGGERVAALERKNTANGIVYDATFTIRGFENQLLSVFRTDSGGTPRWSEDIIYRGSAMLAQATASTGIRHYALDHLGSPRLITTGSTGLAVGTQSFEPFGSGGTSDGGALQFTAHERDAALFANGLTTLPDYMHARYYDSSMGRFLSMDPGRDWDPKQPQSWNMYSYTRNNPINRVDSTGRCSSAVLLTAFFACGAFDLIDYARERGTQVMEGARALGDDNAPSSEKAMGAAVIGIIALEIGANALEPGEGATVRGGTKLLSAAKTMDHHLLPQQFRKFFSAVGINIDKFTVTLSQSTHLRGVHGSGLGDMPGGWNKVWKAWIESNPNATAKEIYQQLGKMLDDFKLNDLNIHEYRSATD